MLRSHGWFEVRQSGSHVVFRHTEREHQLVVPNHGSREVKKGMLMAVLKQAGIKTRKR